MQGCGIVTYESHEEAANALETLNESHTFPPMDKSMVLKWVDHDLQDAKKRKVGPGGFMGGPGFGEPSSWWHVLLCLRWGTQL